MTKQQFYPLHCGIQEYCVWYVKPCNLADVTSISKEPAVSIITIEEYKYSKL
jgi:hypothetical protein